MVAKGWKRSRRVDALATMSTLKSNQLLAICYRMVLWLQPQRYSQKYRNGRGRGGGGAMTSEATELYKEASRSWLASNKQEYEEEVFP